MKKGGLEAPLFLCLYIILMKKTSHCLTTREKITIFVGLNDNSTNEYAQYQQTI